MKILTFIKTIKWYLIIVLVFAGGVYYFFGHKAVDPASAISFSAVSTVERGAVTSGIQTTGNIIAAQKLDIDIYKKLSRIDVVNIQNGSHVSAGDVLISFDKNDAYVDTKSALVSVAEAELSLEQERANADDPNAQIRTKENQIAGYKKTIIDTEQEIDDSYRDFLNEDLEVVAHPDRQDALNDRTEPVLTGRYVSDESGQYVIDVYSSNADSGYSFRVNGLESVTESVIFGKAVDLGTRGLKITFPNNTKTNDKWVVQVPNSSIATYSETKENYDKAVADLQKTITDTKVSLVNAEQELKDLQLTDSNNYRNLDINKAETTLAEARQRLSQNYDVVQERDIIAPFSGTVEGMENVVAGATPTGGTSDSINLGVLISDEFLTTFTLGATDVSKIHVGQKVKVTVTSFANQPVFEASVTQISSIPESSGVAQYKVQALLDYDRTIAEIVLREGMLANIEVVEKENSDTLRIPTSAITYEQGTPKVTVVDQLTDIQKQQVAKMGIVRTEGNTLSTYTVPVEVGIVGQYYVEILNGLEVGDMVVTSSLTETTEQSVVQQAGFSRGGGEPGVRPTGTRTNEAGPSGASQNK
ncbi:HlyD family efflux transporter periplasmic adaptor subunit [Candidatus Nomurabacteria bacterium]|nr:HlyD family efflux transporter periplasmic adaptor subunit [Candidatus Kaiserbacteria bacterium]MCB9811074.1 HlyD family efflux transporter periplasmic adaptor subunit [Candidatus Nomurabacteria bacterium]MCB9814934.1 HlyD family efflux transporter periplasmic adaptor subunit [Candidatus Nomurabacteria bacterium]